MRRPRTTRTCVDAVPYPAPMDLIDHADEIRTLLEAPSPAVLTVYRPDGAATCHPSGYGSRAMTSRWSSRPGTGSWRTSSGIRAAGSSSSRRRHPSGAWRFGRRLRLAWMALPQRAWRSRRATSGPKAVGASRISVTIAALSCACRPGTRRRGTFGRFCRPDAALPPSVRRVERRTPESSARDRVIDDEGEDSGRPEHREDTGHEGRAAQQPA